MNKMKPPRIQKKCVEMVKKVVAVAEKQMRNP
jgi:hypothetical protein